MFDTICNTILISAALFVLACFYAAVPVTTIIVLVIAFVAYAVEDAKPAEPYDYHSLNLDDYEWTTSTSSQESPLHS